MLIRPPNASTPTTPARARAREGMAVEWRKISTLIPYARNARTHSEAQIAEIAGSIREFGFTNPVLIDPEGGIIAGHGRVLAARQLGMDEIPTICQGALVMVECGCEHCGREFSAEPEGGHRALCGSSTESDAVARLMGGERAVLVTTDPPYLVDYKGVW